MKRFLKYYREKKGMSLVWITLLLFVFLVLAATAIDIAFMYYAKNQLQVAADAAALAGVVHLGGADDFSLDPDILEQEVARQKAWFFACQNTAFGDERKKENVYLVTEQDCNPNAPPSAEQLNGGTTYNNKDGDIVVGHFNELPFPCSSLPGTPSVKFCPANGGTILPINAIKVIARRTFDDPVPKVSIGNNPVRLFLGQVFRVLGGDNWKLMSAKAEAIASRIRGGVHSGITMCFPGCKTQDPDNPGEWLTCEYPYECDIDPPRVLDSGPCSGEECFDHYAWTTLRQSPTPASDLSYKICNEKTEDVCHYTIWTTMGSDTSVLRDLESAMYDPTYDAENKETEINEETGEEEVTTWTVTVPIIGDNVETVCPPGAGGWQEATVPVGYYARVRIIKICAVGTYGCRGSAENPYNPCSGYGGTNNVIVFDKLSCVDCDNPPPDWVLPGAPALVK